MHATILFALAAAAVAFGAPVNATVSKEVLIRNGKEAQKMNALFKPLKLTDACTNKDSACVGGDIGVCVDGKWKTAGGQCGSESCFAIPSIKFDGVLLACQSESNARAIFDSIGVEGGIFGATTPASSSIPPPTTTPSATVSVPPTPSTKTVTVTVLPPITPEQTVTVTTTLSPEEASKFLSKYFATASTTGIPSVLPLSSSEAPSGTPSPSESNKAAEPSQPSGSAAGTTITLNPAPVATEA